MKKSASSSICNSNLALAFCIPERFFSPVLFFNCFFWPKVAGDDRRAGCGSLFFSPRRVSQTATTRSFVWKLRATTTATAAWWQLISPSFACDAASRPPQPPDGMTAVWTCIPRPPAAANHCLPQEPGEWLPSTLPGFLRSPLRKDGQSTACLCSKLDCSPFSHDPECLINGWDPPKVATPKIFDL